MKSLNVKKIATVAAGAALLGTAFAGAALDVDETNLGNFAFFSNGEPQVQVVLGSLADASDGVVAANIAATLGNLAFTKSSVTATADADDTAPAATTTNAAVSVTVKTPGTVVPAGSYGFSSFWGDDRVDNGADNTYNRSASKPAYNGALAPTKEVSTTTAPTLLTDTTVDTKGKYSGTLTQREFVNLFGQSDYSSTDDKYIVRNPGAWYSLTFSPGLPACLDSTQAFATCPTNSRLDRAGIKLRFLGADYLVSEVAMSTNVWNSMTLSKASIDKIVSETENITSPEGYVVQVQSISAPQGSTSVSSIGLKIISPAGASELLTVTSGSSPTKVLGNVYVQVPDSFYTTSPGQRSSARVIFSTGSVRMVQNSTIDESVYGKWQVSFTTANISSTGSQSITRLQLGNDFQPGTLKPNDGLEVIQGAPGFKWTFQGSSLTETDYTTLSVEPVNLDSIQVNGNATSCSFSAVRFTSSRSDAFRFGNDQESQVWWLAKNRSATGCNLWNGVWLYQNSSSIYAASVGGGIMVNNFSALQNDTIVGDTGFNANITFYYPGSGTDSSVVLNVNTTTGQWQNFSVAGLGTNGLNSSALYEVAAGNTTTGNVTYVNVTVPEILNESTTTAGGQWNIALVFGSGSAPGTTTATDLGVRDALGLTTAGKVNYTTIPSASSAGVPSIASDQAASFFGDAPLYSPRGGRVTAAQSSTTFTIGYASKLGRAQYVLASAGTNLSSGTSTVSCTPGVACDVSNGYLITLPTTAAAAAATDDEETTAETVVRVPVGNLVVLDSDAGSQPAIVVGGPFVNSVAASMEGCAALADAASGDAKVLVEGDKICVAGYSAEDTASAGAALVDWLKTTYGA